MGAEVIAAQLSKQALVDLWLKSLWVALPLACCIPVIAGDAIILQDTFDQAAAGEAMSAIADRQRIRSLIIRQRLPDETGCVTAIFATGCLSAKLTIGWRSAKHPEDAPGMIGPKYYLLSRGAADCVYVLS